MGLSKCIDKLPLLRLASLLEQLIAIEHIVLQAVLERIGHVQDCIQWCHLLVRQCCGELLLEVVLELVSLAAEYVRNVGYN